jgi:hypothetical protein
MTNATTITLYTKTLSDAVGADGAEFDAALPGYIDRVQSALPDGVTLEINEHDLSASSLRDDDDQQLAGEINQRVEFWS